MRTIGKLICQRKDPDLEFYSDDFDKFHFPEETDYFLTSNGEGDDSTAVSYRITMTYDEKNNMAVLHAGDYGYVEVPAEEFCMELMDMLVTNRKLYMRDAPALNELVDALKVKVAKYMLEEREILMIHKVLPGFGYIKSGDAIISTFESIMFFGNSQVDLIEATLRTELKQFDDCSIKFYFDGKIITAPILKEDSAAPNENEPVLTNHTIEVGAICCNDHEPVPENVKPRKSFHDVEAFIQDRDRYLTKMDFGAADDMFGSLFQL